jgi:hypothetical protein
VNNVLAKVVESRGKIKWRKGGIGGKVLLKKSQMGRNALCRHTWWKVDLFMIEQVAYGQADAGLEDGPAKGGFKGGQTDGLEDGPAHGLEDGPAHGFADDGSSNGFADGSADGFQDGPANGF